MDQAQQSPPYAPPPAILPLPKPQSLFGQSYHDAPEPQPEPQSAPPPMRREPQGERRFNFGRNLFMILAIVAIVVAVAVAYKFNVFSGLSSVFSPASSPSAFSGVSDGSQATAVFDQLSAESNFNITYTGNVTVTMISSVNTPMTFSISKYDGLFRLGSAYGFGFYNGSGIIICPISNPSYRGINCSYQRGQAKIGESTFSVLEDLISSEKESIGAVIGLVPELDFTFLQVQNYGSNPCSLMSVSSPYSNLTATGTICFSNDLGAPLFMHFYLGENTSATGISVNIDGASSPVEQSGITYMPPGARVTSVA